MFAISGLSSLQVHLFLDIAPRKMEPVGFDRL